MARTLADRDIKRLFDVCIKGGDEKRLNPNGIELRLGNRIRFINTAEEFDIPTDSIVKVGPGEAVIINSLETLDFSKEAVNKIFPKCCLMAWINPTTTMMREGIIHNSTKVDAGFRGKLNWGLRNSGIKDLILVPGEAMFKLTIDLLEGEEVPDNVYGQRPADRYQGTQGIMSSGRTIPADTSRRKVICSSREKVDPKQMLKEAGHPFDHIGSELVALQGRFELVSTDVTFLKGSFEDKTRELGSKIESETSSVIKKVDDLKGYINDHTDHVFSTKFLWMIGSIVAVLTAIGTLWSVIEGKLNTVGKLLVGFAATFVVLAVSWMLTRRTK